MVVPSVADASVVLIVKQVTQLGKSVVELEVLIMGDFKGIEIYDLFLWIIRLV